MKKSIASRNLNPSRWALSRSLKGLMSRDGYFLKDLIKSVIYLCALMDFQIFLKHIINLLATMNWLTNSSNPFHRLWSGPLDPENAYRNLPVVLKYHTGSRRRLGFFLHPIRCGHRRKSTNDREESQYRNSDAASGAFLRNSKGFSKQALSFYLFFSLTTHPRNLKTSVTWK
jgi:hypothetical protein